MKLFYSPGACSLVVRIILNELGISFDDELVDLRAKKTASAEDYLKINPKGAVPAIQLNNGEILTENQVILQYLADSVVGQTLLAPVGDLKRYRILETLNYISTELHKSFGWLFNPNLPQEVKIQVIIPHLLIRFERLNEQLSTRHYLLGDSFTLPDAYLFVMTRWAQAFKIDLSSYMHLSAFIVRLNTRESVVNSLQQEGL